MIDYLSYEQYEEFGGELDEEVFNDLVFEAQTQIDWYTFNRLQKVEELPDAVPRCMYYLINLLAEQRNSLMPNSIDLGDDAVDRTIASQSNDGVSTSYNILSASQVVEQSAMKINKVINKYLGNVRDSLGRPILYRGLYPYE